MSACALYFDNFSTKTSRFYKVRVPFYGNAISTFVTNLPEAVNWWIYEIKALNNIDDVIIGLDVRVVPWGPSEGRVATLHLCVSDRCLVFQIYRALSLPPSLNTFLTDPKNILVGLDVRGKLDMLQNNYGIGGYARYRDLGTLAANKYERPELSRTQMAELEIILIGEAVVKRNIGDSKWHYSKLSDENLWSATVDAFMSLEFGILLLKPPVPKKGRNHGEKSVIEQVVYVQFMKRDIVTTVTKHRAAVEKWIDVAMNDGFYHRYVGFDLELFFINKQQRIGTVQFCVGSRCLVIRFYMMNGRKLPNLERFLLQSNSTFVGVGIVPKMEMLLHMLRYQHGGRLRGIDMSKFAAITYNWPLLNYARNFTLARLLLKTRLEMPELETDDWYRYYSLSSSQVVCACFDAAVSFEIASRLCPAHY